MKAIPFSFNLLSCKGISGHCTSLALNRMIDMNDPEKCGHRHRKQEKANCSSDEAGEFWQSQCLAKANLSPRCSSARGINPESAVLASVWNSCNHDVLQLVKQPYVSLKHLPPRCFSACGAKCAIVCLSCLCNQLRVCDSCSVMLNKIYTCSSYIDIFNSVESFG